MSDFFKSWDPPVNLLDEQAFEANRRGEITAAQKKKITPHVYWQRTIFMLLATMIVVSIPILIFIPFILSDLYGNLPVVLILGGIVLAFLLIIVYDFFRQIHKWLKVRRDIASCAIRHGQGQLAHNRIGYFFEMNGGALHLAGNLANRLIPGVPYQVYYLAESGALLSAKAVSQVAPAQTQAALNEILASAHGFSADDLLANRNEKITPAQRRKLIPNIMLGIFIMLGVMLFIILFVVLIASWSTSFVFLLFLSVLIGIWLIFGFPLLTKSLLDVALSKPQAEQGVVSREKRVVYGNNFYNFYIRKGRRIEHYYTLNGQRFPVSYRAYTALIVGLQYRIYYLPNTLQLLSIEVLD